MAREFWIEMEPEKFGKELNGGVSPDGCRYQMLIYPLSEKKGDDRIEVSNIGEIRPGEEFVLHVKIVEPKKKE